MKKYLLLPYIFSRIKMYFVELENSRCLYEKYLRYQSIYKDLKELYEKRPDLFSEKETASEHNR